VLRGVHSEGRLVSTHCPICGNTILDLSPPGTKFILAIIFGMMILAVVIMYFGQ